MKLQKHISRKSKRGDDYYKYEIIIPKEFVEISNISEEDELYCEAKEGEIKIKRKE